ncbi:DUF3761 domain-containing protein [Tunturibacter empetritectus]|uniref:RecA/RadA family phage recombinase n=1 Tax=Tunturiibacter lichenicola TaxID=2051959 RepID=A0A7W8N294_9BACT|nr:DUF3761 domain-containing protein [Edaphobacter lichenicola]MBB5342814.1 putative RecA/RadA family phage recombinase [Edaphobacter lichenicola]
MKISMCLMAVAAGLVGTQMAVAQAAAPAGSTGMCKDGTYSTAASKAGACRGHQGVKEWYAASTAKAPAAGAAATAPAAAPVAAAKTAPVAAPAAAAATAPAAAAASGGTSGKLSPSQKAAARPLAAGGGPGLVWVNTSSNVYHCYGSDFYGKTKEGSYMSEADAKAKGAHGDHGKSCTK